MSEKEEKEKADKMSKNLNDAVSELIGTVGVLKSFAILHSLCHQIEHSVLELVPPISTPTIPTKDNL